MHIHMVLALLLPGTAAAALCRFTPRAERARVASQAATGGALHLPSAQVLATAVRDACAMLEVPADNWLDPEDAAQAAALAISTLSLPAPDHATVAGELPLQGEHAFSSDDYSGRFAEAEEAAFAGDSRAQQTLGLLLFAGVGGCEVDVRHSAYWHAAAAAQGNLDALATLGGCVRRGVGAAQDEATGVALIRAAAAAGSPVGLCKLGVCHDEGTLPGLPADAGEGAVRPSSGLEPRTRCPSARTSGC